MANSEGVGAQAMGNYHHHHHVVEDMTTLYEIMST
jgi:hypothetical protein